MMGSIAESQKRSLRVFLCHASADKPSVRILFRRLVADGVDAWLDQAKLLPGQNWKIEIPKAVTDSDIVIVCLSKNSITKEGYVQKEIKAALDAADEKPEGTIFIIPVRLEDCDVPDRLSIYQWVDLFAKGGYNKLIRALISRAEKIESKLPSPHKKSIPNDKFTKLSSGKSIELSANRYFAEATRLNLLGNAERALQLYRQVKEIDPRYPNIDLEIRNLEDEIRKGYVSSDGLVHQEYFAKAKKEPVAVTTARISSKGPIIVAIIGLISTLVLGYWQFVLKSNKTGQAIETEYVGRVIDVNRQQGIAGAKITLDLEGVPPIVYSDSEGVYRFKVVIDSNISGQIRVDAPGYQVYTRNITLSLGLGNIEDIRLMPDEQSQATEPPSFIGYDFETDTAGWNTSEGAYKRAILGTTTLIAYNGSQALVLDTELYGNGSLEFANHGQEDIYRHTEALVYFNQIPEGIDYPGPYDLTGKRLSCFVYLPIGLVAADEAPPTYVRLALKDKNFSNQFSEAVMINNETTEQWLELIYVVNLDPNSNFDTTQVNALGVRLDSLDDSTVSYNGPIYIDYCTIDF